MEKGSDQCVKLRDPEDDEVDIVESDEEDDNTNFESSSSSSSSSTTCSSFSGGTLFEFSDLMANLPIKRGLSRYYDGKSQSFTRLGRATSLEDLIKKDFSPYKKRMKSSKSYASNIGSDLRHHHHHRIIARSYSPKATIAKKGFWINSLLPSPTGKRATSTRNTVA